MFNKPELFAERNVSSSIKLACPDYRQNYPTVSSNSLVFVDPIRESIIIDDESGDDLRRLSFTTF